MSESHWRTTSNRVIYQVLKATDGQTEREIKKALEDAYPFGERKMHPYKIWLDAIKKCRHDYTLMKKQMELFNEEKT